MTRSAYNGFAATIKLVGTGPRGSRDLDFHEARAAMADLLAGRATPAQAGAFLVAMRLKGEAPEELAGFAAALRDAAEPLAADTPRPLLCTGGAYDGVADAPHLSVAAAVTAAACGAGVVMHCGGPLGPKHGLTQADVLGALGTSAAPTPEQSRAMLERAGAALVYTPHVVAGWEQLAAVRDQVGVRGPVHAAERLLDYFGARRFVVGFTHSAYSERLLGALQRLGAERAVAVRGIEGSVVLRPGRPTAIEAEGALELPHDVGDRLPADAGPEDSAALTRALLDGDENGALAHSVALSAGVQLYAAGLAHEPNAGVATARSALEDGRAAATLDALLG